MSQQPIKITKWMIFRRKVLEGLSFRYAKFQAWRKQLTESRRAIKPPLTVFKRELSGQPGTTNNSVIQIGVRNRREGVSEPIPTRSDALPLPRRRAQSNGTTPRTGRGIINVSDTKQTCPACTAEMLADEPWEKCRANKDHVIHARCVDLVRNICPICKGGIG